MEYNGVEEYQFMESEGERILWRRYKILAGSVERIERYLQAILITLITTLAGVVYSLLSGKV